MIQTTQALIDLLNGSDTFLMADLYTITTKAGQVLRYTSADVDLTVGGFVFGSDMKLKRGSTRQVRGIEVDDLSVTFFPEATNMVGSVPFLIAVGKGALDGADFKLERAFFSPTWTTYVGSIIRFMGRIEDIEEYTRTEIPVTVKSDLVLLNVQMPRNIYQPGCRRTLYDAGCGVLKTSFSANSTVAANSTTTTINCALAQTAGWFDLGSVTFTSGQNTGVSRTVKSYTTGVLVFALPLPYAPATGDAFTAYAGCNKQQSTCSTKFNNLSKFSGEPYIPAAETAY